jgi:hypothetical protein
MHARRTGNRYWEWSLLGYAYPFFAIGEWDEALEREQGLPDEEWEQVRIAFFSLLTASAPISVHRGLAQQAKATAQKLFEAVGTADVQEQTIVAYARALFAFADGRYEDALVGAEDAVVVGEPMGIAFEAVRESMVILGEAALALGDTARLDALVAQIESLPPGSRPQFLEAHAIRFRARSAEGADADRLFRRAVASFRELEFPFYLAVTLLEHAEFLSGPEAEPLLSEAGVIFERLGAAPWLERVQANPAAVLTPIGG